MRSVLLAVVAFGLIAGSPVLADPGHGHGNHGDEGDRGDKGDRGDHGGFDHGGGDHGDGDHHDNGKHKGWYKNDRRYADQNYIDRRVVTRNYSVYDYNRPDPRYGNYSAERYYRQGNYPEQRLSGSDRIYRGGDGRYYCRRNDGTTGLLTSGGSFGSALAPRGSNTLVAVLQALGGGVGRGDIVCR